MNRKDNMKSWDHIYLEVAISKTLGVRPLGYLSQSLSNYIGLFKPSL